MVYHGQKMIHHLVFRMENMWTQAEAIVGQPESTKGFVLADKTSHSIGYKSNIIIHILYYRKV